MKIGKDGWLELDPAQDFDIGTRAAFENMKRKYADYKDAKQAYEDDLLTRLREQDILPEGKALVFGYNFGKASIKIVEAGERKAKREAKPQATLADYLAAMSSGGHRT